MDKLGHALTMLVGEIVLAIFAAGLVMILLPVITLGRVRVGDVPGRGIYSRRPNGDIIVDVEFAVSTLLLLIIAAFVTFALWKGYIP